MLVPAEDVDAIAAGELDDTVVCDPLTIGTVHAIQTKVGERARCYVEIVERWAHSSGGWVVRFKVVAKPHSPRLLHRNPGAGRADYTASPGRAMREEGEAPSKDDELLQRTLSHVQALRDREQRRNTEAGLPLEKRVANYLHEAKHRRIDIRKESRLLHRMLDGGRARHAEQQADKIRAKLDQDLDRAA